MRQHGAQERSLARSDAPDRGATSCWPRIRKGAADESELGEPAVCDEQDALFLAELWSENLRRCDREEQVADLEQVIKEATASPEQRLLVAEHDGRAGWGGAAAWWRP